MKYLKFLIPFIISSCSYMEATDDSVLYVSGKVVNSEGDPLSNIAINLNELSSKTNSKGCFIFDGAYPEKDMIIQIASAGFMPLHLELPYNAYHLSIVLSHTKSGGQSSVAVHRLDISDPNIFFNCE